jgi:hypothetical protein
MSNKNIEQQRQLAHHLDAKIAKLLAKLNKLNAEIEANPTAEKLNDLSLLRYHIECTENRIKGRFINTRVDYGIQISTGTPALILT